MKLEVNIDTTLKEMENLTEVEIELRRRLRQMTDHLIQKQAQVDVLRSYCMCLHSCNNILQALPVHVFWYFFFCRESSKFQFLITSTTTCFFL